MHKIIFLVPYFGKWPEWIELYFDSLERNPSIDFHFFTDCDTSLTTAKNIIFHTTTFKEYLETANNILNAPMNIPNPYKICDLRPFFGVIHEDVIKDYDFFLKDKRTNFKKSVHLTRMTTYSIQNNRYRNEIVQNSILMDALLK